MLVLSCQINESIRIGDSIRITVLKNKFGEVSLGIEAPNNVLIMREELLSKADRDNTPAKWQQWHAKQKGANR